MSVERARERLIKNSQKCQRNFRKFSFLWIFSKKYFGPKRGENPRKPNQRRDKRQNMTMPNEMKTTLGSQIKSCG